MYCKHCGRLVDEEDVICPSCGYYVNGKKPRNFEEKIEKTNSLETNYENKTNTTQYNETSTPQQARKNLDEKDGKTLAILALVFSIFCSFFGLVIAVIGLSVCKEGTNRKLCIAALIISISWVIIGLILGICLSAEFENYVPEFQY